MSWLSSFLGLSLIVLEILVCALGVGTFLVLALNNFDAEIFFQQMANVSDRFLSADADRRTQFMAGILTIWVVILLLILLMKLPAIRREFKSRELNSNG